MWIDLLKLELVLRHWRSIARKNQKARACRALIDGSNEYFTAVAVAAADITRRFHHGVLSKGSVEAVEEERYEK